MYSYSKGTQIFAPFLSQLITEDNLRICLGVCSVLPKPSLFLIPVNSLPFRFLFYFIFFLVKNLIASNVDSNISYGGFSSFYKWET